jgi:alpha-tubulin suppressor-like RCC1 family protein
MWSLALRSDGSLSAWGRNDYGQCDVPETADFKMISAGRFFGIGLRKDGSLMGWGANTVGQCDVPPGNDYISVSAGMGHGIALRSDGSIVCWGLDDYGQVSKRPSGNGFLAVSAGEYYSLAIKSDRSLVAWGNSGLQQCAVPPGTNFKAIDAGDDHGVALRTNGSVVSWGYYSCDTPSINNCVAVSAGYRGNIVLQADGGVTVCGRIPSMTVRNIFRISDGYDHSLALGFDYEAPALYIMSPNGGETFIGGNTYAVQWIALGDFDSISVLYSYDNKESWITIGRVYTGNSFEWKVPLINSQHCWLRINDADLPMLHDTSDAPFTIYICTLTYDLTRDCVVDIHDFALLAAEWLRCGNPFDILCQP